MAHSALWLLLGLCFVAHSILAAAINADGQRPLVPAVYVFGDSTADAGNNNHLNTLAKADKWPYGIDFNNVTGRFTNARTGADFLATYLGLPLPPPFLNFSLADFNRWQTTTGVSYASGGCGILDETGAGGCLTLSHQVSCFIETVEEYLPQALNPQDLEHHLHQSIYLLLIGNNDYIGALNNNLVGRYSPEAFADYLLQQISVQISVLHSHGARKFMVSAISICEPHNYSPPCESRYYADKLPQKLQDLQGELEDLIYTIYDGSTTYKRIFENPANYGFTHINEPCYAGQSICPDRSKYNQFDKFGHQTEASLERASIDCFNGTACSPYTLYQLANLPLKDP